MCWRETQFSHNCHLSLVCIKLEILDKTIQIANKLELWLWMFPPILTLCHIGHFHWRRCSTQRHSAGEAQAGEETVRCPPPPPQNRLQFLKEKKHRQLTQYSEGSGCIRTLTINCSPSGYLCRGVLSATPHHRPRRRRCCSVFFS